MHFLSSFFARTNPARTLAGILLLSLAGCGAASGNDEAGGSAVTLKGTLTNCGLADSIRVYQLEGQDLKQLGAGKVEFANQSGTFNFTVNVPSPGLYVVGVNPNQNMAVLVVLGPDKEVTFTSTCPNFARTAQLTGSPANDNYGKLMNRMNLYQNTVNSLAQNRNLFMQSDPAQVPRIQEDMNKEFAKYAQYLDSTIAAGGFNASIAKLQYFNFYPDVKKEGKSELVFFLDTFWEKADMKDPAYAGINLYFEKARNYAATMAAQNVNDGKERLQALIDKTTPGSANRRVLMLGYLSGLEQVKGDELFVHIANLFIIEFASDSKLATLQQAVQQKSAFMPGSVAPDIALTSPDGSIVKLSDLRGQIVMIDFWASWCRPCRAENPNVVKAYNKYHSAGFEILGVSLDEEKTKWVDAIAKDGLTWKHVSDLRGWQSSAAKTYGVGSIPATVLLDKEGRIIARNLRGPALEEQLKKLFGF